jgi:hypothetical protein
LTARKWSVSCCRFRCSKARLALFIRI